MGLLYNTAMTPTTELSITPLQPFDFYATAYSHGWVVLAPNRWDATAHRVQRPQRLDSGEVVLLDIWGEGQNVRVTVRHQRALKQAEQQQVITIISRMFRTDLDLSDFYKLCKKAGPPWSQAPGGLGRLLRSPTVFEDLVKTICTTNIQWGGTQRMAANLVEFLGEPFPGDPQHKCFPTPQAMAQRDGEYFTEIVRMGYRGPYVAELAQRVASGELELAAWEDPQLPTDELRKQLLAVKGVGAYAAATMLMLLGRYDQIAVDTEFRKHVSRKYFDGEKRPDEEMLQVYQGWGEWQYLAFWMDIWSEEQ